ncbi:MAG: hypothetical protein NZM12_03955 [Steroidobacteraceae bacterium]|nr:hypothetical protein [Steroidobacteraceae bacterium]
MAQGDSGPINRFVFDVAGFDPAARGSRITCHYEGDIVINCRAIWSTADPTARDRLRIVVEVPDIDRGPQVGIRFQSAAGAVTERVSIANRPRLVHEIESLALPRGGQSELDGRGQRVPILQMATTLARTQTARAASDELPACGSVFARWRSANATDPVFTSAFGVLTGSVILSKPPPREPITTKNGPEWLITYPLGAQRVQFIAHYELEYRVRYCGHPDEGKNPASL